MRKANHDVGLYFRLSKVSTCEAWMALRYSRGHLTLCERQTMLELKP